MTKLTVVDGDISRLEADAIVNAANDRLWMGSGVAGAIKKAGGEKIEQEAVAKGPIAIGDAVETQAGNLAARYVIHAAVMGQDLRTEPAYIERATVNSLRLASKLGCKTIALPAFGTGVGGFSPAECAHIMVSAARSFLEQEPSHVLSEVVFATFGKEATEAFIEALAESED